MTSWISLLDGSGTAWAVARSRLKGAREASAPQIMALAGAVPFVRESGIGRNGSEALKLKQTHLHRFGGDFAVEGYLRDPYAD